jgi:DNA-damage-inducible protein D
VQHNLGKEVRDAIKRIGGVSPEQLPPAEHIKLVEKRVKSVPPKLKLDEKDATGLTGHPGYLNKENLSELQKTNT